MTADPTEPGAPGNAQPAHALLLPQRRFTDVHDVANVAALTESALAFKSNPHRHAQAGRDHTLGMIFFNPSLRTRMSTHRAAALLGMSVMTMDVNKDTWKLELEDGAVMDGSSQEHIKDAVQVMCQYCQVLAVRTFAGLQDKAYDYEEQVLLQFLQYATVPVVSLESATRHPLQSLTDLLTIKTVTAMKRPKVVLSWAPHPKALPQAVANSFAEWMLAANIPLTIVQPPGFELEGQFTEGATITHNQQQALKGADVVYAKNWSAVKNYGQAAPELTDWTITAEKMALTNNGKFMHCLPIRRNVVATDAVLDGPASIIYEQAQNRIYAAQAVLYNLITNL